MSGGPVARITTFSARRQAPPILSDDFDDLEDYAELGGRLAYMTTRIGPGFGSPSMDDSALDSIRIRSGALKRSRDKFENMDGKDVTRTLNSKGAVVVMLYRSGAPDPQANDVWPNFRNSAKLPARYCLLDKNCPQATRESRRRRSAKIIKMKADAPVPQPVAGDELPDAPVYRPEWKLPVELLELIASHLNRDDIKSMRLVSRELNHYVSQVIFKTVVVPFNTEIYGMLGQEQKPDLKGKNKAKAGATLGFTWKNANGDDVYNGHGLDVFRGFGRHIRKFGMSFEVNEDALAKPPEKSLTERHTSFWGSYDWPFEEYRRFDDVAGLESAADETPRMKTAFSELSKVRELALSLDSGLGWLNGPDRSIRARILQRPPEVFGTLKKIPDRRAQAQQELWEHIEACHGEAASDVKVATLYKLEASRPLSELQENTMAAEDQPEMPFLDPHIVHQAIPHDTAEIQVPSSFEDPEVLDRFVSTPVSSGTGILFSSTIQPTDAGQLMSPIIPSNLTKAQKEWLLETEWAQRAFMSSYMLSIIDNPVTFIPVHTFNISRLSDRYIPLLNRIDFWNALPNLTNVTLTVIPSWRTVSKDEAGFVETPKINPSGGIDPFYDLLRRIISRRQNITKLTIGWVTGGEHAEGMHARNKLILPAPLMTADMVTSQDPGILQNAILQLPFVEDLTLKNCWMTPAALRQFVKEHDNLSLKHLVLNSVSITAILRPHQNAQQAVGNQQPAMAGLLPAFQANGPGQHNAVNPGQILQFHIQALHLQIQHMTAQGGAYAPQVAALQAQLTNQINLQQQAANNALNQNANGHQAAQLQLTQVNNLAALFAQANAIQQQQAANPPAAPTQAAPNVQSVLRTQPREGSWMNLIDVLSPGPSLADFGSEFSQADAERRTSLQSIEFISCGYAKLPYSQFDQNAIEAANGLAASTRGPIFTKRYNALAPAMLSPKWALLGEIVQDVDISELAALNAGWDLETGWKDQDEARAVEFDGLLPGGTGRFTGVVRASDRVAEASAS